MRNRYTKSIGLGTAIIAVLSLAQPAVAADPLDDASLVPDANAALSGRFQTTEGDPLRVLEDDGETGERTVVASAASGELVRFIIQYSSVTDADRAEIKDSLGQAVDPSYSDVKPSREQYQVSAPGLDGDLQWAPVSVIATTSDMAAIAWSETRFTAQVDGAELRSQDGQVEFPIDPDTATPVLLEATVDAGSDIEFRRERQIQASPIASNGASPLTYQQYTTAYVHKTFIPEATVPALYCLNLPSYSFGGDNRGFQYPTNVDTPWGEPNYRTMLFGNVNWDNPSYNYVWTRDVGASKIYNNGSLVATLYADTDEMNVTDIQVGSTYAKAYFNHTASNPHCKFLDVNYGGAIRYAEWVEYYRSGTVSVDGYRYKAPAHEMYARFNTSSYSEVWRLILRRYNEGFGCLLGNGACGLDFYQQSASY